ncbi:capsule biosynthesis protein [Agrobacterium bohemicum]|uniref:Capsular biosynthesis protein n=1 Tax=Agrobacterium bohemicum TaxID=2052828 RepID=A0A135P7T3_9HYPH|nr:capsular biosynthesis protein [Agrobacterium bohemicum]KXG87418.1 capsular biosynthesis protein [Agrobacterium bohemicum]
MSSERAFLFLQGPSSPLFAKIAQHLTRAGRACYRINLNVGDQIFWRRGGASNYRGSLEKWGSYIRSFMDDRNIGTIILLGEERPYHKEAVRAAKERGLEVVVIEMGYLRPDWVTVELDGMSSNSRFPNDPDVIFKAAADLPEPDWTRKYSHTFLSEALADLTYYLPSVFLGFLYPRYRFHGIFHPLAEYAGWIVRLATQKSRERDAGRKVRDLVSSLHPRFVYPLQLETDYQLRAHSRFKSQRDAISEVITSFARHANTSHRLIIKLHPLDNGLISWRKLIEELSLKCEIKDRVTYIEGGDLAVLMKDATGIVTVNSSAALPGLMYGVPTKVLGGAIYDVPGLSDQKTLDEFWNAPDKPNGVLVSAFVRLLAAAVQVRGNFYSRKGADAGAKAIADRVLNRNVNFPAPLKPSPNRTKFPKAVGGLFP